MRALLVRRDQYLDHLRDSTGHDGTKLLQAEINILKYLPDWFWMVEFSLPSLFTGNRTKLGECIITTDLSVNVLDQVLLMRLPSLIIIKEPNGRFVQHPVSMMSHSPLFIQRSHDHVW